jgi:hypothetical protein
VNKKFEMEYVLFPVEQAGRTYLKYMLTNERGIAGSLERRAAGDGKVYALAPSDTPMSRVEQLKDDFLGSIAIADEYMAAFIADATRDRTGDILLVQDLWAKPSDYGKPPDPDVWICGENVYFWRAVDADEKADLVEAMRGTLSYFFAAFLTTGFEPSRFSSRESGLEEELASRIAEVYLPAYDCMSWLI